MLQKILIFLAISLSILYNYFYSSTKFTFRFIFIGKFLDINFYINKTVFSVQMKKIYLLNKFEN